MIAGKRFTPVAALAATAVALGAAGAGAAQIRISKPVNAKSAGESLVQRVHSKRTHRNNGFRKHATRKGQDNEWLTKRHRHHHYGHAKRWHSSATDGLSYVRPQPYAYIYRYQPYVYHRPRVYIRPIPAPRTAAVTIVARASTTTHR